MKLSSNNSLRILSIIIVVIAVVAGYFYFQYQKTQKLLQNPTLAAQEEVKALVTKVATLMELPQDEQPTVATISDKSKLKDQPFFINAENGDKVLIYTNAKKAIIYRPSTNKIIEVGPVNIGPAAVSPTPSSLVKVALYNGTNVVGLTSTIEKDLTSKMDNVSVVKKDNAAANNYTKTLVIDLSGKQAENAKKIAQILNGDVGQLPKGETVPSSTDILVILGK